MLKTPIFWLMFAMMTMMSTGGLMVTSKFANFARDFGVADVLVLGLAALPFALTIDRLLNGFTRPFFGWLSDRIGRENTMGLAFVLEGAAILLLLLFRGDALAFVVLSGLVFFGWGEIFSLFPSTLTDTFGSRHATTNYGFLYIAQGVGSVLGGPVAASMTGRDGKLDARVRRRRGDGCRDRAARALRAEADARRLSWRPGRVVPGQVGASDVSIAGELPVRLSMSAKTISPVAAQRSAESSSITPICLNRTSRRVPWNRLAPLGLADDEVCL